MMRHDIRTLPDGGDLVRSAEPDEPVYGHIADGTGKPCLDCAARGRLTWLDPGGGCRRADSH